MHYDYTNAYAMLHHAQKRVDARVDAFLRMM